MLILNLYVSKGYNTVKQFYVELVYFNVFFFFFNELNETMRTWTYCV